MTGATSILMYHSVSDRGGATAIARRDFAMQMRVLAESGVAVLSLDDWLAAREFGHLPARSVIITFDDGFQDFAEAAWPAMGRHGFRPIVYLPTGHVGGEEGWKGIARPPRQLMGWDTIRALATEGVLFGSHTVSHPDLTALDPEAARTELVCAQVAIEDRLARPVMHFAPPYGLSSPALRAEIARHYRTSVGTRLGEAGAGADLHDLPRIEMFYFTDERRWRDHLAGRGGAYLAARRLARAVKAGLMKPWAGL
ncbi:MAG: polysaccharide deacetylase family protein [Proteobacteria bacterium]|nr:polysaccharide deacetylase family protein [Pseudomonadota bacterium]MBS0574464.1 polysaccharide deacetylase family protein [Pseudomonadota bacterium]